MAVIGISGPIAAGKTTAARYLEPLGYRYGRYSEVLARILCERGLEVNRENLQDIGREINEAPGQEWLNRQLMKHIGKSERMVIDGLRFPEDYAFWVESFGPRFVHVYIDAPEDVRLQRYLTIGHSQERFLLAKSHSVEQKVLELAGLAHIILLNTESKEVFFSKLKEIVLDTESKGGARCQ
jgi:dephospho-CoA kinase